MSLPSTLRPVVQVGDRQVPLPAGQTLPADVIPTQSSSGGGSVQVGGFTAPILTLAFNGGSPSTVGDARISGGTAASNGA